MVLIALCALFFLGCALIGTMSLLGDPRITVVSQEGLELRRRAGSFRIGWGDIEELGCVTMHRQKMVGVRVREPEATLRGMPDLYGGGLRFVSGFARLFNKVGIRMPEGTDDVATMPKALRYNRETLGYDIVFGWADRDRSGPKFLALLERYRGAATADSRSASAAT